MFGPHVVLGAAKPYVPDGFFPLGLVVAYKRDGTSLLPHGIAQGGTSSPASTTSTRTFRSSASFSATIAAVMPDPMMQTSVSITRALI
jgi:hypothetical protein